MYRQPNLRPELDNAAAARRDALIRRAEESRQPFEPEVALFLDDSAQSEQARQMFEEAQIPFRTLTATGSDIPAAVFGGMRFAGNANIGELIRTLTAISAVFVASQRHAPPQDSEAKTKRSKGGSTNRTGQPTAPRRAKSA